MMNHEEQPTTSEPAGVRCKYCDMIDCPMPGHRDVATETATIQVADEPPVMTHPGIPLPMAIGGVVMVIVLSHFVILRRHHRVDHKKPYRRFDLLSNGLLKGLVRKPFFPLLIQSVSIFLFTLIVFAGLFGNQRVYPVSNIATVLTWNIWWALLIFFILCGGTIFCAVCPWEGISSLVTSFSLWSRKKRVGSEIKWPKIARNIYPAMVLFILLTWLELGMDLTQSPMRTAVMAVGFLTLAVVVAILFEKRTFCRYLCLVGRIQGLYALFSPLELRPRAKEPCRTCEGKECYHGSDTATGCPTELFPAAINENNYCTLCTECIRACPHDNLTIHLRLPATDLTRKLRFHWDEAILAIVLLALTSFHGLTMTGSWIAMTNQLRVYSGLGKQAIFTLLMTLMILWPIGLFLLTAAIARRFSGESTVSVGQVFKAFAYSVIPIALFYHLAHNGMHFFMEGQYLLPLASDPFGWGWNLFGTAGKTYSPLLTLRSIWWMQIVMILVGHVYGVVVADRVAGAVFSNHRARKRALIPLLVTMVFYSCFSIWLIAQPMEMRSGM